MNIDIKKEINNSSFFLCNKNDLLCIIRHDCLAICFYINDILLYFIIL